MKTVWKYELLVTTYLDIPVDAVPLTVQLQREIPCIWFLVDTESPTISRTFRIYRTGEPIEEENVRYMGTFLAGVAGRYAYHLFEIIKKEN